MSGGLWMDREKLRDLLEDVYIAVQSAKIPEEYQAKAFEVVLSYYLATT